ncbi:putative DNA topoisomerase [Idiomarina aquatica]|uniref:Putative DNA topoisomerase n=1 Tax=Idiomarina aquatica TaxID=1327752 RepID=A0A4R6P146_9GAMM|nr:topoisomerase DNA-binding C4 zinc finger domain-containing protein [Idiomarina aquatica]TDP27563.1 putative DNA topoisomerase [Idiomarina aquatica]
MQRCPECGSELQVKHKGHNSFLACSAFPACEYTQGLRDQADIEPEGLGVDCPECGRELQLKSGRYGLFVGCSGYPGCDFVAEPDQNSSQQPTVACPECQRESRDGKLIQKTTRTGRSFYACDKYPQCEFSVNLPPIQATCPLCQYPLLLRKKQHGVERHVCARKSCDYKSDAL